MLGQGLSELGPASTRTDPQAFRQAHPPCPQKNPHSIVAFEKSGLDIRSAAPDRGTPQNTSPSAREILSKYSLPTGAVHWTPCKCHNQACGPRGRLRFRTWHRSCRDSPLSALSRLHTHRPVRHRKQSVRASRDTRYTGQHQRFWPMRRTRGRPATVVKRQATRCKTRSHGQMKTTF